MAARTQPSSPGVSSARPPETEPTPAPTSNWVRNRPPWRPEPDPVRPRVSGVSGVSGARGGGQPSAGGGSGLDGEEAVEAGGGQGRGGDAAKLAQDQVAPVAAQSL